MMVIFAMTVAFGLSFATVSFAGNGPEEITLDLTGKKPAVFPHKKHQDKGLACAECHHTKSADGSRGPYVAGEEKACKTCHTDDKDLKKKFHSNCKGCHKEKGVSRSCSTCHPRKK